MQTFLNILNKKVQKYKSAYRLFYCMRGTAKSS